MSAAPRTVAPKSGSWTVLTLLWSHRRPVFGAALLVLLGSVVGLAQPLLAGRIIDAVREGLPWGGLVAALLILFVAQLVVDTAGRYLLERAGETVMLGLRRRLIHRILRLPIAAYDRLRSGDVISRITHDTTGAQDLVTRGFVDIVVGAATGVAATVLMVSIDPLLFFVVLGAFLVAGVGASAVLGRIQQASQDRQRAVGQLAAGLDRVMSAIRTVRVTRAERREDDRLMDLAGNAYSAGVRAARLSAVAVPAVQVAATGSFLLVLVIGGVRVASGDIQLGELITMLLYATYLVVPLGNLFEGLTVLKVAQGAYRRIEEVFEQPLEQDDGSGEPITPPSDGHEPVVRLSEVTFRHGDRPILRGVSFDVRQGSRTAVVGPSGAGKTTVLSIICRFLDPDAGQVSFFGRDIRSVSRSACRALIGLVEQDAPILYGTFRENLTFAAPDATPEEQAEVLRTVNLDGLVARLPEGLETVIGERGRTLSGGERQRLAIARALLARPALLLLDEPTANLDPHNEEQVLSAIRNLPRGCAVLTVSHGMSAVQPADQVILLVDGVVEASGTHDSLKAGSAAYTELLAESSRRVQSEVGAHD